MGLEPPEEATPLERAHRVLKNEASVTQWRQQ